VFLHIPEYHVGLLVLACKGSHYSEENHKILCNKCKKLFFWYCISIKWPINQNHPAEKEYLPDGI